MHRHHKQEKRREGEEVLNTEPSKEVEDPLLRDATATPGARRGGGGCHTKEPETLPPYLDVTATQREERGGGPDDEQTEEEDYPASAGASAPS